MYTVICLQIKTNNKAEMSFHVEHDLFFITACFKILRVFCHSIWFFPAQLTVLRCPKVGRSHTEYINILLLGNLYKAEHSIYNGRETFQICHDSCTYSSWTDLVTCWSMMFLTCILPKSPAHTFQIQYLSITSNNVGG